MFTNKSKNLKTVYLSKNAFSEKNAVHPIIGTFLKDFLTNALAL
jgi:hypothetical protein